MTCCKTLESIGPMPSPFVRLLVTGYYDGPTTGIAECGACGRTYAFRMLAWDDAQDVRIVSLAPLDEKFDTIYERTLRTHPVSQAVTIVPPLLQGEEPHEIDRLLATPPTRVVASVDLLSELLASEAVSETDLEQEHNWFKRLGLSPSRP